MILITYTTEAAWAAAKTAAWTAWADRDEIDECQSLLDYTVTELPATPDIVALFA